MKKQDWPAMDAVSVSKVKELCEQVYHGTYNDRRPGKVTRALINRLMGWPKERIKYLPLCEAVVMSYQETWHQYWAREIEWAWEKLTLEKPGSEISWTNVYDLTSIRKHDLEKCLCHINNPVITEHLDPAAAEKTI